MNTILTVSQINSYLKAVIDYDENLNNVYVCGEISNFTNHYRTGHFYFTLKDDKASIKAVMFSQNARMIRFEPYNGLKVLIRGRISVFERDGVYQLYATDMQPDGLGQLNLAYEQLKSRLEEEGLFDSSYKKPIPAMPERIAVVTSLTGAAIQDIINVITRRYSCCELIIAPVQVQGENSASQIAEAIDRINKSKCADVIIVGRGGGSIEDLWSFNEEVVARAIFASEIPIISAVGHETDFTISDFVADLRAPTPSAAAELATPDIGNLYNKINSKKEDMLAEVNEKIFQYRSVLSESIYTLFLNSPSKNVERKQKQVSELSTMLRTAIDNKLTNAFSELKYLSGKLDALSPLKTLSRGYTLTFDSKGTHINSASEINKNDSLTVKFKDGKTICLVKEVVI